MNLIIAELAIYEHACQIGLYSKTPLSTNWESDTVASTSTELGRGEFKKPHESSIKAGEGKFPLKHGGQISGLLKMETKLVWIGWAVSSITSSQEWEQWRTADNAGKDTERLKKEEEEREKQEADDQKASAPPSSPSSDSPRSQTKSKFPGWAGLLDGVVVGCVVCSVCSCCIGKCIMSVPCPECTGKEQGIGMDDLERGGAGLEGIVPGEAVGLVGDETETASLPPYGEVEK